ncbi:mechanosensitive ion channel family protein [Chloroflexota bacterium]
MWQWFTTNSVWLVMISTFILVIVHLTREWAKRKLTKIVPPEWYKRMSKSGKVAFRTIEGLALMIIAVALVFVVLSQEGAAKLVTPETIQKWFLQHGVPILVMLMVGFGLWVALNRFLPPLVRQTMARPKRGESLQGMKKRADTLVGVFLGLGKIIIAVLIFFMVLSELNVQIAPILAGFGIAGIAVGFGAQYLIRDLIAGIFILMENQYRVGDVAGVGGITTLVEEVNLRKTVLRDLDGVVHHVPNGEIKVASNYSRHFSRVNLDISVSYGTDLDYAIQVINRVGQELATDKDWGQHIITPPKVLRVNKLGDSGIDIKILGNVKPLQQWALMGELRLRLKRVFDEEGIEIPWPHVKLYFGQSEVDGPIT